MTMENAVISLKSVQHYSPEEEDSIEFSTDGFYKYENGTAVLSYFETEVTGMLGTRTSLLVSPDEVVIDRSGLLTSRMVFKEGLKDSFLYSTPYGSATVGIDTRGISQNFGEDGGQVEIDYVVNMEHALVIRNNFQISVRRIGEESHG